MTPEPRHPGALLKEEFLDPIGVTPYRLAKAIGVHVRRVSELIKGHRSVTQDTAIRLGLYFDVPALWWLEMQARFDAHAPARSAELATVVQPFEEIERFLVSPEGARELERRPRSSAPPTVAQVSPELMARIQAQASPGWPSSPA